MTYRFKSKPLITAWLLITSSISSLIIPHPSYSLQTYWEKFFNFINSGIRSTATWHKTQKVKKKKLTHITTALHDLQLVEFSDAESRIWGANNNLCVYTDFGTPTPALFQDQLYSEKSPTPVSLSHSILLH